MLQLGAGSRAGIYSGGRFPRGPCVLAERVGRVPAAIGCLRRRRRGSGRRGGVMTRPTRRCPPACAAEDLRAGDRRHRPPRSATPHHRARRVPRQAHRGLGMPANAPAHPYGADRTASPSQTTTAPPEPLIGVGVAVHRPRTGRRATNGPPEGRPTVSSWRCPRQDSNLRHTV